MRTGEILPVRIQVQLATDLDFNSICNITDSDKTVTPSDLPYTEHMIILLVSL